MSGPYREPMPPIRVRERGELRVGDRVRRADGTEATVVLVLGGCCWLDSLEWKHSELCSAVERIR